MAKNSDDNVVTERGDAILRRMLQTKPKPHKEMVEERKANQPKGTAALLPRPKKAPATNKS